MDFYSSAVFILEAWFVFLWHVLDLGMIIKLLGLVLGGKLIIMLLVEIVLRHVIRVRLIMMRGKRR